MNSVNHQENVAILAINVSQDYVAEGTQPSVMSQHLLESPCGFSELCCKKGSCEAHCGKNPAFFDLISILNQVFHVLGFFFNFNICGLRLQQAHYKSQLQKQRGFNECCFPLVSRTSVPLGPFMQPDLLTHKYSISQPCMHRHFFVLVSVFTYKTGSAQE